MIPECPQPDITTNPCAGIDHQRHVFGKVVFFPSIGRLDLGDCPLQFRSGYLRGTGPVSQTPFHNLHWMIELGELASARFIIAARVQL